MANIITVPLPQDLPTNWVYGQTIGPQGTDVGLTQRHGYNYLMEQVNASQQAAQELGDAVGNSNGIASLGNNGQMPYAQTPHLTSRVTVYVDASTGNDSNPGTQGQPFKTIQAAVNSLPKDLSTYNANINIADGTYDEDVNIIGFHAGTLDYGLNIIGNQSNASAVQVKSLNIRSCSAVISLRSFTVIGTSAPLLNIGNSSVLVNNLTLLPAGNMEYSYSYFAVNIGLNSNVRLYNFTVDLSNNQSSGFSGLQVFLSVISIFSITVKNCQTGIMVGDNSNYYCGIALFYDQPTFENNTVDTTKSGAGSIISGLEGQ